MLAKSYIEKLITQIDFFQKEGENNIWFKSYTLSNNYIITINLESDNLTNCKIDWGSKIENKRKTTSNFSQEETIVILECVDRLLEKGYQPDKIILEKDWRLGHKEKGYLDILVLDESNDSFLMIECKTWKAEYTKELSQMLLHGGQLFSYFSHEPDTKFLCLYTSRFYNEEIEFKNSIVEIKEDFRSKNQQGVYEEWNKLFQEKGLFEGDVTAYNLVFQGIRKKDLENLKAEDGGYIYNKFAEILRRHVVSDKTNAFNKMFNLFLCKVVDEDNKTDDEEMSFQWKENENNQEVLLRLNDLYKEGMMKYLRMNIADYSQHEVDNQLLDLDIPNALKIKNIITELRLYKNNEFAFKEVFDKKTFDENCVVVKESIKLLEGYRIKYHTKQQFLGDFFEKLLNTGIKQEAGQFFTPIPITKFICDSIPIEDIINDKIRDKNPKFLPYAIDYASGSGHFITEVMDRINKVVLKIDDTKFTEPMKDNYEVYKRSFKFAEEFVYGIEKDYRLAKTTKVSCFLNGDGEANIICGDGLANFYTSKEYTGLLNLSAKTDNGNMDNQVFDVLVANPPYSVSGFKNTTKYLDRSFTLYNRLTYESSEIECVFVERAKQLLKNNGYAGIILPVSMLSNNGTYADTREILLKYFDIKAIVELGSNTFMATGTNTIILFLKRKDNYHWIKIKAIIDNFFKNNKDVVCNGIKNSFTQYAKFVYKTIKLSDYISLISGEPNDIIIKHDIYIEYHKAFNNLTDIKNLKKKKSFKSKSLEEQKKELNEKYYEYIREIEKEKILYFMITYNQKLVHINSGQGNIEKDFLGYEFSNRRGYEGIKMYTYENGKSSSKLYNEDDLNDSTRVNSYILKSLRNEDIVDIDENLKEHLQVDNLHTLLNFDRVYFDKSITLSSIKKKDSFADTLENKYPIVKLKDVCELITDGVHNTPQLATTGVKMLDIINMDDEFNIDDSKAKKFISVETDMDLSKRCKPTANDVLLSSRGTIGKIAIVKANQNFNIMGNIILIRPDNTKLFSKYIAMYLKIINDDLNKIAYGKTQKGLYLNNIRDLNIILPPIKLQKQVVEQYQILDGKTRNYQKKIIDLESDMNNYFSSVFDTYKDSFKNLKNIALMIQRGKSPKYGDCGFQVIKSGQARGYYEFDFSKRYYLSSDFKMDNRKLQKEDILINSTGVGTAGRVTYFALDDNYAVDSHITILRLDKSIALSKFILYCLGHIGFDNIEKMAKGQSGQIELSLEIIKNIKVPIPSINSQLKMIKLY